jgi:hypothetical protein
MKDKRARSIYNYINKQFLKRHCVVERMRELTTNMTFPAPQDKIKEYEKLDKLRMEGRKLALRKCRKVYVSKVDSHPDIKRSKLRIRLIELLIQQNSGHSAIKWRTVTDLAHKINKPTLPSLDNTALYLEWRHTRRVYYQQKKNVNQ